MSVFLRPGVPYLSLCQRRMYIYIVHETSYHASTEDVRVRTRTNQCVSLFEFLPSRIAWCSLASRYYQMKRMRNPEMDGPDPSPACRSARPGAANCNNLKKSSMPHVSDMSPYFVHVYCFRMPRCLQDSMQGNAPTSYTFSLSLSLCIFVMRSLSVYWAPTVSFPMLLGLQSVMHASHFVEDEVESK